MKVVEVMESEIQVFEHPVFGKMHVVMIENNPRFFAIDTCRALEIKNPRDAVSRLNDDEKCSIIIVKNGVTNSVGVADGISGATSGWLENRVNVVNEPGLYHLIFPSRKPEAKEFQHWVYHEVLPAIRKYGYYSLVPATSPAPVRTPNPKRRAAQLADACVYAAKMSNGTVKIGNCHDIDARKPRIRNQYKLTVEDTHNTSLMSRKIARAIEKVCHEIFSPFKVKGEFFNVDYAAVCRVIDSLDKFVRSLPSVSNYELGNKLLTIAGKMTETNKKQATLDKAAKLLVDTAGD